MEGYGFPAPPVPDPSTAPRRRGRRWLVIGGVAVALGLALAIGMMLGSVIHPTAQAAVLSTDNANQPAFGNGPYGQYANAGPQYPMAGTPGAQGGCISVTVTSISGSTIVGKEANGTSLTIHTTSGTQYRQAGQSVARSAIKVGSEIHVMGTHNSDGSITATSIDIR
jgi:hypothetical protein